MALYPYAQPISGLEQIIKHLRKSYLKEIDAKNLKSLGIAPNNESYIVNTLRSLGMFDSEGKAVEIARDVFVLSDDEFGPGFAELVKKTYAKLFDLHSEDAWLLEKRQIINFFRTEDKSSELVGNRQADTFIKLAEIAQKRQPSAARTTITNNIRKKPENSKQKVGVQRPQAKVNETSSATTRANDPGVALTVRIEINVPSDGDEATYDAIFKNIRKYLLDNE